MGLEATWARRMGNALPMTRGGTGWALWNIPTPTVPGFHDNGGQEPAPLGAEAGLRWCHPSPTVLSHLLGGFLCRPPRWFCALPWDLGWERQQRVPLLPLPLSHHPPSQTVVPWGSSCFPWAVPELSGSARGRAAPGLPAFPTLAQLSPSGSSRGSTFPLRGGELSSWSSFSAGWAAPGASRGGCGQSAAPPAHPIPWIAVPAALPGASFPGGSHCLFQPGPVPAFPTEFPVGFLAGARNFSATVTSVGIASGATGVAPSSPGCIPRLHHDSHLWHKRDTVIWDRSRPSSRCGIPRQSPGGVSGSGGAGRRRRALLRTGRRLPKGVPRTTLEPRTRKSRV